MNIMFFKSFKVHLANFYSSKAHCVLQSMKNYAPNSGRNKKKAFFFWLKINTAFAFSFSMYLVSRIITPQKNNSDPL